MVRYENQCCGCDAAAYPCIGSLCPLARVAVYTCDRCGKRIPSDDAWEVDGMDLCARCAEELEEGEEG